ncbi:hypothetical protein Golob_017229, partial [Gossypium lobatum]|nr:hypothetical protein [Gossypium lobatum]
MAISLSKTFLSITHQVFPSEKCRPVSFSGREPQLQRATSMGFATRSLRVPRVSSKTSGSLSSSMDELDKETREERRVADVWREIHGVDDWVGMLDPMDPLLRSELIRYGEMAQACYDAFDFDPFSKYCGSCRFTARQFFDSLAMADHGYVVSRYIFATSNINLPNFFKKSRWPKVWSKSANWIGYVAVSNDEISKRLGRRDIVVAWRGTVTRL